MNQLMSVEKLQFTSGQPHTEWQSVTQMTKPRLGACATYVDGHIYIVGGWNGTAHDPSMERMQCGQGEESWETIQPMRAPRTFAAIAPLGNTLYICGGMTTQRDKDLDVQW